MQTVPCLGCGTPLDPGADGCQVCLRGRSRDEIMRGFVHIRQEERRRRRRPFLIAGALAAAALLARSGLWRAAKVPLVGAVSRFQDAMERAENPGVGPRSREVDRTVAFPSAPAFRPTAAQAPPAPAPAAQALKPAGWTVEGRVVDALSLAPLAARISFTSPDGSVTRVRADAQGRFRAVLPALSEGGYALSIRQARYSGQFLEEGYVPFAQLSPEQRRAQVDEARASKVLHVPITVDETGRIEYNVALLPPARR